MVYWFRSCFFICCFWCRTPSPDTVLVIRTPLAVFSTRNPRHNQKCDQSFRGSRLASSRRLELPESSALETNELEPLSAARCRVFKRSINKVSIYASYLCHFFFLDLLSFHMLFHVSFNGVSACNSFSFY